MCVICESIAVLSIIEVYVDMNLNLISSIPKIRDGHDFDFKIKIMILILNHLIISDFDFKSSEISMILI